MMDYTSCARFVNKKTAFAEERAACTVFREKFCLLLWFGKCPIVNQFIPCFPFVSLTKPIAETKAENLRKDGGRDDDEYGEHDELYGDKEECQTDLSLSMGNRIPNRINDAIQPVENIQMAEPFFAPIAQTTSIGTKIKS